MSTRLFNNLFAIGTQRGEKAKKGFCQIDNRSHESGDRVVRTCEPCICMFNPDTAMQSLPTAQLCAVSIDQRFNNKLDMATLFFTEVFGTNAAPRVMSGIIALSIFGNIVVMTFTASRGTGSDHTSKARFTLN